jgi:lipopolysaccharide/colanic/teichoic acid biosynthesis glycosyltransferase
MKRLFDVLLSSFGLLISSPILLPLCFLIWAQDFRSPFYVSYRVGKRGKLFKMVKLRSMVVDADRSGVDSTSANDPRITPIGVFVRSWKLDELPQLWNVLKGEMSFVGPRPNVQRGVEQYTEMERNLLNVRPGITDIASIVFADEGDILKDSYDPDLDYDRLIRPWKSRLGLLYVNNHSVALDLRLIYLTIAAIVSRPYALSKIQMILGRLGAEDKVREVSRRQLPLEVSTPPNYQPIA